ncbi:MAG: hypothetical protein ACK52I_28690, partial [Pseudomonadota bacterium]
MFFDGVRASAQDPAPLEGKEKEVRKEHALAQHTIARPGEAGGIVSAGGARGHRRTFRTGLLRRKSDPDGITARRGLSTPTRAAPAAASAMLRVGACAPAKTSPKAHDERLVPRAPRRRLPPRLARVGAGGG